MTTPYTPNTPDHFMANWPRRSVQAHKGTCGHALVIAGSRGMIGSGFLASKAALRVGAGLVTYALASAAYEKFDANAAEVMVASIPDDDTGALTAASQATLLAQLAGKQAVAIGPGLGRATPTMQLVHALIPQCTVPTVLDADALHAIADDLPILQQRKADLVLTPHSGEMARLCGHDTAAISADRIGVAQSFATTHGVYVVLKGHRTVMASPDGSVVINTTGNAGMATAGAGDVLTGILTGLFAQGMPTRAAMHAAVYLHGLAGDCAAAHQGEQAMIASDIIDALPEAIRMLDGNKP